MADAPRVGSFANDPEIARYTANIPYPYPKGLAEVWIAETQRNFSSGTDYALAVAWRDTDALIGVIGLKIEDYAMGGELGYWIARPFWRRGLATEACRAMVVLAFNRMGLPKLWAGVRDGNEGSLKVLQKPGFCRSGRDGLQLSGPWPHKTGAVALPGSRSWLEASKSALAPPLPIVDAKESS